MFPKTSRNDLTWKILIADAFLEFVDNLIFVMLVIFAYKSSTIRQQIIVPNVLTNAMPATKATMIIQLIAIFRRAPIIVAAEFEYVTIVVMY